MAKYVKNNTGSLKTYKGQDIAPGQYYKIQLHQEEDWAVDSVLLADIANSNAVMARDDTGSTDIADLSEALEHLKDQIPSDVVTSREKNNKTLKTSKVTGTAAVNAATKFFLKIPGDINYDFVNSLFNSDVANDRLTSGGELWCPNAENGDFVEIKVVDRYGLLGGGAEYQVGSFIEPEEQIGTPATAVIQDLYFVSVNHSTGGNNVSIEYTSGGTAGAEAVTVTGNAVSVQIEDGVSTAYGIYLAIMGTPDALAVVRAGINNPNPLVTQTTQTATNLSGGVDPMADGKHGWYVMENKLVIKSLSPALIYGGLWLLVCYNAANTGSARDVFINIEWEQFDE